jgi:hypothetical protein
LEDVCGLIEGERAATGQANGTPSAGDRLARLIVYRKFFDGDRLSNFNMFDFTEDSRPDGKKSESLCWRLLCPQDATLHAAGCAMATRQNEERPDAVGLKRRYYVGFREATLADLVLDKETFMTEIEVPPRDDAPPYHVHLTLSFKVTEKKARAQARSEAKSLLGRLFGSVAEHICPGDTGDDNHPARRLPANWLEPV